MSTLNKSKQNVVKREEIPLKEHQITIYDLNQEEKKKLLELVKSNSYLREIYNRFDNFVSDINRDDIWETIVNYLEEKGYPTDNISFSVSYSKSDYIIFEGVFGLKYVKNTLMDKKNKIYIQVENKEKEEIKKEEIERLINEYSYIDLFTISSIGRRNSIELSFNDDIDEIQTIEDNSKDDYYKLEAILMFLEDDIYATEKKLLQDCYSLMICNDDSIESFEMFMETSMILLFKENDKLYVVPSVIEVNM